MTITFKRTDTQNRGCYTLLSVFASLLFFVSLIAMFKTFDTEDIKEYFFELLFITIMLISFIVQFFRKKANNISSNLLIKNDKLFVDELNSIPLSELCLDLIQHKESKTTRYHLWDINQKLSIYASQLDELSSYLKNGLIEINTFIESSYHYNKNSMSFVLKADSDYELVIDVESGAYHRLHYDDKMTGTPLFFANNPEFKIIDS